MNEELYFNNELRKCLNAAGLSDCGENDQWNYWYQRLHKAHDAAVDRVTETQRAENAKLRDDRERMFRACVEKNNDLLRLCDKNAQLRELVRKVDHYERLGCYDCPHCGSCYVGTLYDDGCAMSREIEREMRALGIEVDA